MAVQAPSIHVEPPPLIPTPEETLSRQRRASFQEFANSLNSEGNVGNEMLTFAFTAAVLSTIPILLGSEVDLDIGLKRKKRNSDIYENLNDFIPTDDIKYSKLDNYKYLMTKTSAP